MFSEIIIHINGTKSMTIENYKNILDYKENLILLQGKLEIIKITGKDFRIDYFTHESMRLNGQIDKIEFQANGKKK